MHEVDRVGAGLGEIAGLIDAPHLEPDPSRKDWDDHRQSISNLIARVETEVIGPLPTALASLEEEDRRQLQLSAAFMVSEVAAVVHAAGRHDDAMALIGRALTMATGNEELEGAMADMNGFALLIRARWLYRKQKTGASDKAFRRAEKEAKSEAIREAARRGYNAPRPISSAPPLFRLNGCGFSLYGTRDARSDGSHVSTYCISLLFVPVFPLTAYRIVDHGNNSYSFLAKERLSGFARGYRNLLLACVACFFVFTGVVGYLESPERKARAGVEEAQEMESADRPGALAKYQAIILDYGWGQPDTADEAAQSIVRLEGEQGPAAAEKLAARFREWPSPIREGRAGASFGALLEKWAAEEKDARAALKLLELAEAAPSAASRVAPKRAELRIALADSLAEEWPIAALELYLSANASERARAIADRLLERPALLIAHRRLLETMAPEAIQRAQEAYSDPARKALLEMGELQKLLVRFERDPSDQELAVAIATIHRSKGKTKQAIDLLQSLGKPGWMIPPAQQLLGALYFDLGDLERAEAILDPYLASRLDRFAAARLAYTAAMKSFREGLIDKAKYGGLPADVEARLNAAPQEEQSRIFFEYVAEQEAKEPALLALQSEYEAYADVVPASLTLGMVKLRRASEASGEERKQILARAEEVFLSIRAEAEGLPTYHLGLGQVYHRLGRQEEGDKELAGVLAQNDPHLTAAVARVYRELGLIKQAREVAQQLFASSSGPPRDEAAVMLSMLSNTLEEERSWLTKANAKDKFVRAKLEEVDARLLYRDGKYQEADKLFAKVAAAYQREATHNSASANNAALANGMRYLCTGDGRFLEEAVKGLESAVRMEPDNTLILGNLAYQYKYRGEVDVAAKWIDTSILHLDSSASARLVESLSRGKMRDEVIESIQENASLSKSMSLSRQEEVLAPERSDAYHRALARASILRDQKQLEELRERLTNLARVDTTQSDEALDSWKRGDQDAQILASTDADLSRLDLALSQATQRKLGPTIAAIQLLRGQRLESRSILSGDPADAHRAAEAYRAAEAWEGLAAKSSHIDALLLEAMLEARKSSPKLDELWKRDGRELGVALVIHETDPAMRAELVAQKAMVEAIQLASTIAEEDLRISDWILAKTAGDAELERRAVTVFARPMRRLESEISLKLAPSSKALIQTHAFFAQRD